MGGRDERRLERGDKREMRDMQMEDECTKEEKKSRENKMSIKEGKDWRDGRGLHIVHMLQR